MMDMVDGYGFLFVAGVMAMCVLFLFAVRLAIRKDVPKVLDRIKRKNEQDRERKRLYQLRAEAAIWAELNALCSRGIVSHCSVSLFHDGTKSNDGRFDWEFSEVFKEDSVNESYSSEILNIQSTQLYPHYAYLKRRGTLCCDMEELARIDARLAKIEERNNVRYLRVDMVFDKEGRPYGNVAYAWEYVPREVPSAVLDETTATIRGYLIDD